MTRSSGCVLDNKYHALQKNELKRLDAPSLERPILRKDGIIMQEDSDNLFSDHILRMGTS